MADDMDRVENGSQPDLHSVLRERLVFMRGDLIERLAKGGVDGGMLPLLGSVGAAISAIDAVPAEQIGQVSTVRLSAAHDGLPARRGSPVDALGDRISNFNASGGTMKPR